MTVGGLLVGVLGLDGGQTAQDRATRTPPTPPRSSGCSTRPVGRVCTSRSHWLPQPACAEGSFSPFAGETSISRRDCSASWRRCNALMRISYTCRRRPIGHGVRWDCHRRRSRSYGSTGRSKPSDGFCLGKRGRTSTSSSSAETECRSHRTRSRGAGTDWCAASVCQGCDSMICVTHSQRDC